jgi:hypothetical protein
MSPPKGNQGLDCCSGRKKKRRQLFGGISLEMAAFAILASTYWTVSVTALELLTDSELGVEACPPQPVARNVAASRTRPRQIQRARAFGLLPNPISSDSRKGAAIMAALIVTVSVKTTVTG